MIVHYSQEGPDWSNRESTELRSVHKFPETKAAALHVATEIAVEIVTSEEDVDLWLYVDGEPGTRAKWYVSLELKYVPEVRSARIEDMAEAEVEEDPDAVPPPPPPAVGQQSLSFE